ncbi:MAG: iron ABC transporter permease [Hyphomicrobium sp.]|nr:iron ABC transporter permease [Hyphomicrobium sp.]
MSLSPAPPALTPHPSNRGLVARVSSWRGRRRAAPAWTIAVGLIALSITLPLTSVTILAARGSGEVWPHLVQFVLPTALVQTVLLILGVGGVSLVLGAGTAWLVTMYRFPGRTILDRLLVLPLSIPTYIVAYCYVDLLDYAGPVQSGVRALGGFKSASDYWFPDVRSLGGAIFLMSAVLYPYVYLTARASFVQQSVCVLEVARTLGETSIGAFWRVALPLARPALAAGLALVAMETLNDLGAVQHLGVQTLSASIYATWLQRSSLPGAAQIAVVALVAVGLVLAAERAARGDSRYHHTTGRFRAIPFQDIEGVRGYLVMVACALPFVFGFVVPILLLMRHAVVHLDLRALDGTFLAAAFNSISLAAAVASVATLVALVLGYAGRVASNGFIAPALRMSGLGYAVPGTVLALGVLIPLAAFDNWIDAAARSLIGISTGLLLSGTLAALVYALVARFLSVALGSVTAGLERISPHLDAAARTLGETAFSTLLRVHLPLLAPALGAAALLVFVDTMKELPATLLLRPFNFETLATHVYGLTALEQFEQASLGALAIVLVGLVPVLVLHRAITGGRPGSTPRGSNGEEGG